MIPVMGQFSFRKRQWIQACGWSRETRRHLLPAGTLSEGLTCRLAASRWNLPAAWTGCAGLRQIGQGPGAQHRLCLQAAGSGPGPSGGYLLVRLAGPIGAPATVSGNSPGHDRGTPARPGSAICRTEQPWARPFPNDLAVRPGLQPSQHQPRCHRHEHRCFNTMTPPWRPPGSATRPERPQVSRR